ncbi:hypothetical protein VE30_04550 [Vreelandella aquamarina]|jgi:hypothetical protein|nr:hypothetical protein VE30_04550 [Halomonas meridiana]
MNLFKSPNPRRALTYSPPSIGHRNLKYHIKMKNVILGVRLTNLVHLRVGFNDRNRSINFPLL